MDNNTLRVVPVGECGSWFNVFDAAGERVAEVRRASYCLGHVLWTDSEGARIECWPAGSEEPDTQRGDLRYVVACIEWREQNEALMEQRRANAQAQANCWALPFPGIGTWAQDAARDEAQVLAEVSG